MSWLLSKKMPWVMGLVVALGLTAMSQAVSIQLSPPADGFAGIGGSGTLDVLVNTAPQGYTFKNGTLGISVASSNAGVIQFTGATVYTPTFYGGFVSRWSAGTTAGLTADAIDELLGTSVNTAGLDSAVSGNADGPGGTFLFATISYDVIGAGSTDVTLTTISSRPGNFLVSLGTNVVNDVSFAGSTINVVPEPATMAMLAMGGLAMLRRRR